MVKGKTSLKSVQEAQDEVRLNIGNTSWGVGAVAKGKKILQAVVVNDVVTVSTSVAASSSGVDPSSYLQQIAQLQAQIVSLNIQIASLEAEAIVDAATIASLQSQVTSLQSEVSSLQAQVSSLQAQAITDAATITSLNSQITTLNAQVASLTAQLAAYSNINLKKMYRFAVVENFNIVEENFYVPPVFDSQVMSFDGGIKKAQVRTINNYAMSIGGYP